MQLCWDLKDSPLLYILCLYVSVRCALTPHRGDGCKRLRDAWLDAKCWPIILVAGKRWDPRASTAAREDAETRKGQQLLAHTLSGLKS